MTHPHDDLPEAPLSKPIEIEASWAPTDPRDKLYDSDATAKEKRGSIFRIIAAFHPVLNVPVLLYDSIHKFGWGKALVLWSVMLGGLSAYAWFLWP